MKIITVVGARPQFIKAAVVSRVLRKQHNEILIHTGQHYDANMSAIFFEELDIPNPDYNLGISGGSHAQMTAHMLIGIEKILLLEVPDMLLVYGDTNSTLAAALAAAKLHIPICHVEAGTRTYCRTNPEEMNRICTDHLSTLLLTCTELSYKNLEKENLLARGKLVGDPMYDAFLYYKDKAISGTHILIGLKGETRNIPNEYYYLTCHREENTNNEVALQEILKAMEILDCPVVYPVHPRNQERAQRICEKNHFMNTILVEPVGYLTSIFLVSNAKKIITDSGGLQREAFFAEKQCVTVLDFEVWPETMIGNRNRICPPLCESILEALNGEQVVDSNYQPFGDGLAAQNIVQAIDQFYKENRK